MASILADSQREGTKVQLPKNFDDKELAEKCRQAWMRALPDKPEDAMKIALGQPIPQKPADGKLSVANRMQLEFPDCFPKKKPGSK